MTVLSDLYWLLHDLTQGNACEVAGCDCDFYDDTETFRVLDSQSSDPQYASRMLDTCVVGRPMTCDRCNHGRESHARLQKRLMSPECMPNGGAVLYEQTAREKLARRAARFASASASASAIPAGSIAEEGSKPTWKDLKAGDGNEVQYGMEILVSYIATFASDDAEFERNNDLRFTVGKRHVVPGLDDGVRGMKAGGTRVISIPPAFAYGAKKAIDGRTGETLVFTVSVLAAVTS